MNRKLLNGLLLLAVATGGVGTFTSCKDTNEDFRDEILIGQKTLADQIKAIQDLTNSQFVANLESKLNSDIAACNGDINSLQELVLSASYAKAIYQAMLNRADQIGTSASAGAMADAVLEYLYNTLTGKVNQNAEDILSLQQQDEIFKGQIEEINKIIEQYGLDLQDLQAQLDKLSADMQDFVDQMKALNARFANWVSGITVQQTANHIFGTLNIPVSIASNYLGGYYFQSDHAVSFPVWETTNYECNNANFLPGTPSNIEYLAKSFNLTYSAAQGPVFADYGETTGNLGKLYLTVDPATVDYSAISVELVNSQGEAILSPMSLQPSEEVLNLGYTRAEVPSLYEISVNAEDPKAVVEALGVDLELDKDVLKSYRDALKNVAYEPSSVNIISLAKMLSEGLTSDALTAYGVRASWGEGENANSVVSKYDIAVEAIRPLSYHSAYGFGTSKQLPTFNYPLQHYVDYLFDTLKGKLSMESTTGETVSLEGAGIIDNGDGTYTISLGNLEIKDTNGNTVGTLPADTKLTLTAASGEFASSNDEQTLVIGGLTYVITELINQINDQAGLTSSASNGIQAAQDKINDLLSGKLSFANNLFDMYNALASKINEILKDPNHFLQVMMAYEGANGELIPMSTDWKAPTEFTYTLGMEDEEYYTLYVSSHTAELIVPAYKKYVAISNVLYPWKNTTGNPAQVSGLQNTQYNIAEVNATAGDNGKNMLNVVTSGENQTVLVSPGAPDDQYRLREGFVYEVVYSALDHRGYTSTQTYYFTVKYVEPEED